MKFSTAVLGWLIAIAILILRACCRIRLHNDPRPGLRARSQSYAYSVLHAHQIAAVIQLTCSSISPCVDTIRQMVSVPLLKVDEAMIDMAVGKYRKVGIIATAPTTLKPSTDLVFQKAGARQDPIEVESVLCEGAFDAFLAGRVDEHDKIVRGRLLDLMGKVEVVLLAQASMKRIADALEEKERTVPVLSSPRPAVERLARIVSS